ncbi:magnesium transporter CorA family protein [Streptococcus suis]|nr:magnesium transporter CorA family protein [Streptococcus suis]
MIEQHFGSNNEFQWIVIDASKEQADQNIMEKYNLDNELMSYALDKNERAHLEYDSVHNRLLLVFGVLDPVKKENHYKTVPMTFIIQENQLITIINERNAYLVKKLENVLTTHSLASSYQFLFTALTLALKEYFPILDQLDREKDILNTKLRKRTTKSLLFELSDLETGLVYLLTTANQNVLLLEQLRAHPRIQKLDTIELEELDDALVEARQLSAMTQLDSQILQQLSGTYNNILNNNLNDNLTILTILSILLAVVSVITGFFGMNVPLPWADQPYAWIWVIILSAVLWLILAQLLKLTMRRK